MLTFVAAASFLLAGAVSGQGLDQLETARLTQAGQRGEFGVDGDSSAFLFSFADPEVAAMTDNAAVLQQRVTKASNIFLSTLTAPGESQFLTALKPCGILMPHMHQRANEFYSMIFGTQNAGISQENGAAQDITFDANPGSVFVVPQGLMHFNHNRECIPNVFFQSFTSSDPGAINIVGALAAMRDGGGAGAAAIAASGASLIEASPLGSFALDQECLATCGLPATGAPGDGLQDLPDAFRVLFGLGPAGGAPAAGDGMGEDGDDGTVVEEVEVVEEDRTGRAFAMARASVSR